MAKKKTHLEFVEDVYKLYGIEYEILGEYFKSSEKILVKHSKCGNEYHVTPNKILQGRRCSKCFGTPKKTTKDFKKEVFELVGHEYSILGEYISNKKNIEIIHNDCGNRYNVRPNDFLSGRRCPNCMLKQRVATKTKTHEEFENEFYNLVKDEYSILEKYKNAKTNIKIKHNECGNIWNAKPYHLLTSGSRCPDCMKIKSKGVAMIEKWLNLNNVKFEREYKFDDCVNKRKLPFDFVLFINNSIHLIEFDGRQHFEATSGWNSEENVKSVKFRDEIKNKYCKNNNIELLRISYLEEELIDEILNKEIKKVYLNE